MTDKTAAPDGSTSIRGRNILDIRLEPNDSGATTVREYLCELIKVAWFEKRPFGNSSWHADLGAPMLKLGMINGEIADDGQLLRLDEQAVTDRIWEAIEVLAAEPFAPVKVKTQAQQQAARLQRRHSRGKRR